MEYLLLWLANWEGSPPSPVYTAKVPERTCNEVTRALLRQRPRLDFLTYYDHRTGVCRVVVFPREPKSDFIPG